jgi:hypothetical protein
LPYREPGLHYHLNGADRPSALIPISPATFKFF